ncbi:hypothetical protein HDV05_007738 [Chytridiales sp. JEL 0842]|nr:hypothetical protein HDV05_007738 [Chytridiales sp. JEL 0842]
MDHDHHNGKPALCSPHDAPLSSSSSSSDNCTIPFIQRPNAVNSLQRSINTSSTTDDPSPLQSLMSIHSQSSSTSSSTPSTAAGLPMPHQPPTFLKTSRIDIASQSSVLARLSAFLPALKASNDTLQQQIQTGELKPADIDLENVSMSQDKVVQMDLSLGIFDCVEKNDPDAQRKIQERQKKLNDILYKTSEDKEGDERESEQDDDEEEEEEEEEEYDEEYSQAIEMDESEEGDHGGMEEDDGDEDEEMLEQDEGSDEDETILSTGKSHFVSELASTEEGKRGVLLIEEIGKPGRDSMRPYDACYLCLQKARDPMSCTKGHIACRQCILSNVLAQKEETERQKKLVELQKKLVDAEIELRKAAAEEEVKKRFERNQVGVLGGKGVGVGAEVEETRVIEGRVFKALKTAEGTMYIPVVEAKDEKERIQIYESMKELEKEANDKKSLPSFWVPSLTPDSKPTIIEAPKSELLCFASSPAHHLPSIKKMFKVVFTSSVKGGDKGEKSECMCPACVKTLTNGTKLVGCSTKFVKESGKCFVCEKPAKGSDLVELASEGTGFASGGGNVQVERSGIAFQ